MSQCHREYFLKRADECKAMAQKANDGGVRTLHLKFAECYTAAADAEFRSSGGDNVSAR